MSTELSGMLRLWRNSFGNGNNPSSAPRLSWRRAGRRGAQPGPQTPSASRFLSRRGAADPAEGVGSYSSGAQPDGSVHDGRDQRRRAHPETLDGYPSAAGGGLGG